jgi:hypothetical protein
MVILAVLHNMCTEGVHGYISVLHNMCAEGVQCYISCSTQYVHRRSSVLY